MTIQTDIFLEAPYTPWLTTQAISFLEQLLGEHPDAHILELGSGKSTIWFAQHTPNLVSFEHDHRWYDQVQYTLNTLGLTADYRLYRGSYVDKVSKLPHSHFDLMLVDGTERMACIEHARSLVKPGGILMLDDAQRERYQGADQLLSEWHKYTSEEVEHGEIVRTDWWIRP